MKKHRKAHKQKVLFLCTGNSARSIMCEAVLNHLGKERYEAFSAGSQPAGKIKPMTIKVLEAHDIPTSKLKSKSWDDLYGKDFDVVVTVCSRAAKDSCPVFPPKTKMMHWDISDPGRGMENEFTKLEDFFRTYRTLHRLIKAHFLS